MESQSEMRRTMEGSQYNMIMIKKSSPELFLNLCYYNIMKEQCEDQIRNKETMRGQIGTKGTMGSRKEQWKNQIKRKKQWEVKSEWKEQWALKLL